MGFDNFAELRAQFPVTESLIYLNHAAVAPLVRPAAEAMKRFCDDGMLYGSLHYQTWLDTYEAVRRATARLVNVTPEEVALMKNTSEGIATIAMGLDWRPATASSPSKRSFPRINIPGGGWNRRA